MCDFDDDDEGGSIVSVICLSICFGQSGVEWIYVSI